MHIWYLTFSMGQESGHGWTGLIDSGTINKAIFKVSADSEVSCEDAYGKDPLPSSLT